MSQPTPTPQNPLDQDPSYVDLLTRDFQNTQTADQPPNYPTEIGLPMDSNDIDASQAANKTFEFPISSAVSQGHIATFSGRGVISHDSSYCLQRWYARIDEDPWNHLGQNSGSQ